MLEEDDKCKTSELHTQIPAVVKSNFQVQRQVEISKGPQRSASDDSHCTARSALSRKSAPRMVPSKSSKQF